MLFKDHWSSPGKKKKTPHNSLEHQEPTNITPKQRTTKSCSSIQPMPQGGKTQSFRSRSSCITSAHKLHVSLHLLYPTTRQRGTHVPEQTSCCYNSQHETTELSAKLRDSRVLQVWAHTSVRRALCCTPDCSRQHQHSSLTVSATVTVQHRPVSRFLQKHKCIDGPVFHLHFLICFIYW